MAAAVSKDFHKQLRGYGLTTAKIWYTKPDAPWLINPHWLVWQEYDLCPKFPALFDYLRWWEKNLDGKLAIIKVAHSDLIKPAELKLVGSEFRLN